MAQIKRKHSDSHGERIMEPSNNSVELTDIVDQAMGKSKKKQKEWGESSKRVNILNQITIRVADHLWRWQAKKRSALLPPHHLGKGKSIMEPSNNMVELTDIVDQAMGIFHEEILMEILIRLPVLSLIRSKCVSKHWKALISDPYFQMKHLNHAKNVQNFQKLFVARTRIYPGDCTFYCASLLSSVQLVEDEQKLDLPWNWKHSTCFTLCCCDGFVLLALSDTLKKRHLLLWNPSTRESIELPCPKSPLDHCVFGMGYDTTSGDYKILAADLNTREFKISCEILALRGGSWKFCMYISPVKWKVGYRDCGVDSLAFLNGAFHWIYYYHSILSFNMSNELWGEIPLLDGMLCKSNNNIEYGVSILGGMLCLYSTCRSAAEQRDNFIGDTYKLWVMKDYGVKESWTLLYSIRDTDLFSSARPRYRYADGEVLLRCRHESSFGSVYRTSKGPFGAWPEDRFVTRGVYTPADVFITREDVYTESLISPKLLLHNVP